MTNSLTTTHEDMVFVFGSNELGRHGAGAARFALEHRGAVYGVGMGHRGQSYAIPTKFSPQQTLSLHIIKSYVEVFKLYAREHPELTFQVTCIGCGLAGLKHTDIAPMFHNTPKNCQFDTVWSPYLGADRTYWGTF